MSIHLNKETTKLKKMILQLSALVEENVRKAVVSVTDKNIELANKVRNKDEKVDEMEIQIEEECLKILALYQPVANDLRYVIACLKMNSDLERIGDLAANIARRAIDAAQFSDDDEGVLLDFTPMMDKTREMLKKVLDSLIDMNPQLAYEVMIADEEVDSLNKDMHHEVHELIKKDPSKVEYYIHLLSVSRHLERIADYATNIAEDIIYMVEGEIVRHQKYAEDIRHRF